MQDIELRNSQDQHGAKFPWYLFTGLIPLFRHSYISSVTCFCLHLSFSNRGLSCDFILKGIYIIRELLVVGKHFSRIELKSKSNKWWNRYFLWGNGSTKFYYYQ